MHGSGPDPTSWAPRILTDGSVDTIRWSSMIAPKPLPLGAEPTDLYCASYGAPELSYPYCSLS